MRFDLEEINEVKAIFGLLDLGRSEQGRIHGQLVVTGRWAGAAMRVGRVSLWVGGGCYLAGQGPWWPKIAILADYASFRFSLSLSSFLTSFLPTKGHTVLRMGKLSSRE